MPAVPQQRCTRAIRGLSSRASYCFLPQKVECDAGWHLPSQAGGASGSLAHVADISLLLISQALAYLYLVSHCSTILFSRSISSHLAKKRWRTSVSCSLPGVLTRDPVFTTYERQIYS